MLVAMVVELGFIQNKEKHHACQEEGKQGVSRNACRQRLG